MNTKNITKNIIRSGLLSLALLYTGCTQESSLPVSETARNNIYQAQQMKKAETLEETNRSNETDPTTSRLIEDYLIAVSDCTNSFNEGIKDGTYTLEEQRNTNKKFETTKKMLRTIGEADYTHSHVVLQRGRSGDIYDISIRDSRLRLPKAEGHLESLLRENLEFIDTGIPELEKALAKQGIDVYVERTAEPEQGWVMFGIVIALVLGGLNKLLGEKD